MASKSVSAALRQLLQKYGDALRNGTASRDQLASFSEQIAKMNRTEASRSWGDTNKDGKGPKK